MFLMKIVWRLLLGKLHFVQGIFRSVGIDLSFRSCILCRFFLCPLYDKFFISCSICFYIS